MSHLRLLFCGSVGLVLGLAFFSFFFSLFLLIAQMSAFAQGHNTTQQYVWLGLGNETLLSYIVYPTYKSIKANTIKWNFCISTSVFNTKNSSYQEQTVSHNHALGFVMFGHHHDTFFGPSELLLIISQPLHL